MKPSKPQVFEIRDLQQQREESGRRYLEFLREPAMSAGVYVLPAEGADPQKPHQEDELYFVLRGRARMRAGSEDRRVTANSVIFVPAEMEHHFYDISEELVVLVFFAPAETEVSEP
jgi:mannose-6-phosphate isomerase-like protein (cupin superfamily)